MQQVDVAINVLGKPHQTAVTLLSLLEHSGKWIDRIWFIQERRQPFGEEFAALKRTLKERLIVYTPLLRLGVRPVHVEWPYRIGAYRRSVRYQYAWENSARPFLFITHNDVKYTGDMIGAMLERMENNVAVGPVGQCWNCPAHAAKLCGPSTFMRYRPAYDELMRLSKEFNAPRAPHYERVVDPRSPWPLPECRVNEWSMLVNMKVAKPITMPYGAAVPLGAFHGLDIGTRWFHDVINMGQRVEHFDIAPYATHAWASSNGSGHAALSDSVEYERTESMALAYLRAQYPTFVP